MRTLGWTMASVLALPLLALTGCPRSTLKGTDAAAPSSSGVTQQGGGGDVGGGGDAAVKLTGPIKAATTHPRLLLRAVDLPRLRGWATADNPIFENGLKSLVEQCAQAMDVKSFLTDDPGAANGYADRPLEGFAMLFAFYSLVAPAQSDREAYAKRARTLLMYVIDKAALGAKPDAPWRDATFSIRDRSRWFGQGFPLTVDWIYASLSKDDKKKIRTVFLRWADELEKADTTTENHPEPVGVVNDPKLIADPHRVRWAGNNYYTAHMRNLGMMAMSLDAEDDPGDKVRSHITSVTGAWLYVSDALMRGDMRGGLASEGFEYSPLSVGYVAQTLLALYTAGRADPAAYGRQVTFDNPFWNETIPGFFHSLSPKTKPIADPDNAYLGEVHQVAWYGDGEKYWAPDYMGVFGPMGIYDHYLGNDKRLAQLRWIETHFAPGGAKEIAARAGDHNDLLGSILYFLLMDPKAKLGPDPHSQYPLIHFSAGLGRFLQRTSWGPEATWFSYKLGWTTLDHQHADGNMFELWRKGEWLTKERTGYGDDAACTDQKNAIALQNDKPFHADGYRGAEWKRGSQWTYVTNGDGKILASRWGADFSYFLGDSTLLYNSKDEEAQDILYASRSIVWLVPDRIVTYDRAASKKDKRFKRFFIQLPNNGSIVNGLMTMKSAGGQNLYVRTLLPNPAIAVVEKVDPLDDPENGRQPAVEDPIRFHLRVEAPGSPKTIRWLHVIQGADGKVAADNATLVNGTAGTPYQGAAFNNTVVMFPVDIGAFASLSYAAPVGTKAHLITGLTPNAGYKVTSTTSGDGIAVTVTPGGDQKADRGGVLVIGKLP